MSNVVLNFKHFIYAKNSTANIYDILPKFIKKKIFLQHFTDFVRFNIYFCQRKIIIIYAPF